MKILNVIDSMDPSTGGPCQGIRNFSPEIRKSGSQNLVITLDAPDASFLKNDDYPIVSLGPGKGPWRYSPKLIPWLVNNLGSFDVVIVHGLWLYHAFAVRKAISRLQKEKMLGQYTGRIPKVFVMAHGMMDPYFQREPRRRLKALRNWVYWKCIEAKLVNRVDGVLFTCQKELTLAREPFRPYRPKKEVNIGYGIEQPPAFKPAMTQAFFQKCPQVKGSPYLLFLSRIHPKKGVDLLLESYEALGKEEGVANKLPKLVIAGPGIESVYGQKLQKKVASSSLLSSKVFFPGMISGNEKWGAFYECSAFILPSHQENFGIAVAEALACRKPVLISNQVNICDEINTAGGGLIGSDTVDGCYAILHQWINMDDAQKEVMAKKAYALYKKCFAVNSSVKSFMEAVSA